MFRILIPNCFGFGLIIPRFEVTPDAPLFVCVCVHINIYMTFDPFFYIVFLLFELDCCENAFAYQTISYSCENHESAIYHWFSLEWKAENPFINRLSIQQIIVVWTSNPYGNRESFTTCRVTLNEYAQLDR